MNKKEMTSMLKKVKAASLVDAMGRFHNHRAHVEDLVSPNSGKILFGEAVTICYVPYRHDIQD